MSPNILVVDIETAPGTAYVWNLWDDNVPVERLITPGRILCWGAKWVGRGRIEQGDEREGRYEMLNRLRVLIEEADAVVTYNGDKFDLPRVNGELLLVGLPPMAPVTSVDLYKTVKKLGLMSSRLEFFATSAKIGRKIKNAGFSLWRGCMEGDARCWTKMLRYNAGDIRLTERAYRLLRPFVRNHPYLGLPSASAKGRTSCPRCRSTRNVVAARPRRTKVTLIQRLQCLGCGGWFDGSRERVKR